VTHLSFRIIRPTSEVPGAGPVKEDEAKMYTLFKLNAEFEPPNVEADRAGQGQPEQSKTGTVAGSGPSTCWAAQLPPDTTTGAAP
jgi:hypothetical protein